MKPRSISSPVLGTLSGKGLINKPFRFLKPDSAKSGPMKYVDYRPPKLVKTTKRWYVEYYYRVPIELRTDKADWQRFRVFESINRYKTDEYAGLLLSAVERALEKGFSPFKYEKEAFIERTAPKETKPTALSLNVALDKFIDNAREKGLRPKTVQNYGTIVNFLKEYFLNGNKIYEPVKSFTKDDIKNFLRDSRKKHGWVNYTFNNYLGFTSTIFNWFVKEDILTTSPVKGIEELPINITRHKYYDDKTAGKLKELMLKQDQFIYKVCMSVYYAGIRPKSELRFLKVENILADRDLIFIPAEISKNRKDDYIQLDQDLKQMLLPWLKYPGEYYLFGDKGVPSKKHTAANRFANLYKVFKDRLKLGEDFTLYSWKHTRAIHLAEAGASPYEIMQLFRHYSLEMTIKYLRGMGCNISREISDKSRKF